MPKRFATLSCLLLLALPLASQSPEDGKDFWEEQRQYYRQYQAWELPSEAILEWLNQLEQSEKDLNQAQTNLSKALTTFETLKVESEELQKQLDGQRNQLVLQSILTTAVAIGVTALLIVR